jgi:hypothetical protein
MPIPIQTGGFPLTRFEKPTKGALDSADFKQISRSLAKVGLGCADNTTVNIARVAQDVVKSLPTNGPARLLVAPSGRLKVGVRGARKDYEYEIETDRDFDFFSKMAELLANIQKLKGAKLTYVERRENHSSFDSSTIGSIKQVFTTAGSIVGQVQNGHVDPAQMGNFIGDILTSLTETTSAHLDDKRDGSLYLMTNPYTKEGQIYVEAIAGVAYHYHFHVEDYKDKKVETHKSSYEVEQHNIAFTDFKIFNEVYEKFKQLG